MLAPPEMRFKEWNTLANGNGTSYAVGATITQPDGNITLYAIWLPVFSITYDLNGGTGTVPTDSIMRQAGETFNTASSATMLAPPEMRFKEWNSLANGNGTSYAVNATITQLNSNMTLYAIWEAIPTFSITYVPNGGTGDVPIDNTMRQAGTAFTTALHYDMTPPLGMMFTEWNTQANGNGTSYGVGASIVQANSNITLFAIWDDIPIMAPPLWMKGSDDKIITIEKRDRYFEELHLNGVLLSMGEHFEVSEDSLTTTITIFASYLETLDTGDHEIVMTFLTGIATLTMSIPDDDDDGDDGNMLLIVAVIAILAAIGGAAYFFLIRKP
jgi:hypothetical protein